MTDLKTGDVIFVRGNSLLSKAIRYFDEGEFSHVVIAVSNTHIIEAQRFTEVRIVPIYFDDYEVVPMGLGDKADEIAHWAISECGKNYDYLQILSYVMNKFFKTGVWNNPNDVICSELVIKMMFHFGMINEIESDMTPNELYRFMMQ